MISVDGANAQEFFQRWLARGDAIGVFVNHDLSSTNCGHRVFVPLTTEEEASAVPGKTRLPDSPVYGPGWRYLFESAHHSFEEFAFKTDRK